MSTATLPLCTSPIEGGLVSTSVTSLLTFLVASHCALTTPSVWPDNYGPTALENGLDSYDFVIVGSGASGSVVGSRLSENPNVRVLMLEAGDDPPAESKIPAMFLATHRGPQVYAYETEPNPNACLGTKTGTCYWPMAKTMGGTSSIDHVISFRGNKEKFDKWNLPTWSWSEVSKYYDFSEQVRPDKGHLVINKFDQYDTCHISDVIFKGFKELGLATTPIVTGNDRVNIGYTKGFLKDGERVGAGESYLSVVKSRSNIHIIKNAEASRINFEGLTASSVTFVYNGEEMTVRATKEIILAAGAIGNPKLLMLSGIGPQDHLETHGIPVLMDLPGVGQNLQDTVGVIVPFQHKLNKAKSKTPKENLVDLFYYLSDKYGPLSTLGSIAQLGFINDESSCGTSTWGSCRYPDLNVIHLFSERDSGNLQILDFSKGYSDEISQSWGKVNTVANVLLTFLSLQNPESRGYVELQSNNYLDKMKVFANYLEDERDVESLLQGIKFQMDVEQTRAYKKADAQIFELDTPCSQTYTFKSEDYWRCFIKYMVTSIFAPAGTTKMGIDSDPLAVLDLRMNVRGVRGLRAVGSSVYPLTVTSVNTMVAVGERLAVFLKEDYSL